MEQLELNLEDRIAREFRMRRWVWEAFRYAKENDPVPGVKRYGDYYVPGTAEERRDVLKRMYPESKRTINRMNSKQTKLVYHTILKFRTFYKIE